MLDAFNETLPPLKDFILPGGGMAAAHCHLARTICRRAEREVVTLSRHETVRGEAIRYLNRLSDLLFVLARVLARASGHGEVLWQHERRKRGDRNDAAQKRSPSSSVTASCSNRRATRRFLRSPRRSRASRFAAAGGRIRRAVRSSSRRAPCATRRRFSSVGLIDGKICFAHERLWPALVRLADRLPAAGLARVREVHSTRGAHRSEETPFPTWVSAEICGRCQTSRPRRRRARRWLRCCPNLQDERMSTALYTHRACLAHDAGPGHPESPARLAAVLEALDDPRFSALARIEAPRGDARSDFARPRARR